MAIYLKLLKILGMLAVLLYVLRLVITLLSKEKSIYVPDVSRHFFMLFWAFLCLLIAGPLVIIYFTRPQVQPLEASLFLVLGLILGSFALPVFALHFQYFFNDFQKLVEIDKKNNTFKIYDVRQRLYYRKEDIVSATRVSCKTSKFFWSNYEYITFELRNNNLITITSLLMPIDKLTRYLNENILEAKQRTICFIN